MIFRAFELCYVRYITWGAKLSLLTRLTAGQLSLATCRAKVKVVIRAMSNKSVGPWVIIRILG